MQHVRACGWVLFHARRNRGCCLSELRKSTKSTTGARRQNSSSGSTARHLRAQSFDPKVARARLEEIRVKLELIGSEPQVPAGPLVVEAQDLRACAIGLGSLIDEVEKSLTPPSTSGSIPRVEPARLVADAREKLDAMAADLASQERRHRAALAQIGREKTRLEGKLEELSAIEKRYETLKRHLDGSVTWRLGAGLRTLLRAWRKLVQPARKVA